MEELLEKQKKLEVLKLRTQAKAILVADSKAAYNAKAQLPCIESDLLNVKADILEATPIEKTIPFTEVFDKFPDNFDKIFESFKAKK